MKERQVGAALLELLDEVRELRDRIFHAHVLVRRPRAQPNRGLGRPDGCNDGVHDLEAEPGAVLDGASVLVGALVGDVLEELIDEVAVRAVHFDPVEARALNGVLGGDRVLLNKLLDLCMVTR